MPNYLSTKQIQDALSKIDTVANEMQDAIKNNAADHEEMYGKLKSLIEDLGEQLKKAQESKEKRIKKAKEVLKSE